MKKPSPAIARAVAAEMRRFDRRAWTLVEYADADWSHGYCSGERIGAWRADGKGLARVKPPTILKVPYVQFCAAKGRVLIEHSLAEGTGVGAVYELKKAKSGYTASPLADGMKWRTFA